MIKMFKSTKITYYIVAITGFFLIFLWTMLTNETVTVNGEIVSHPFDYLGLPYINPFFGFLLIFIWIIIVMIFFTRLAINKNNKILKILTEECNPQKFIDTYSKTASKGSNVEIQNFIKIQLSTGYIASGELDKGKEKLDSVKEFSEKITDSQNKIMYYNNLFSYFLQKKDIDNAEMNLAKMLESIQNSHKKLNRNTYMNLYNGKSYRLNIEKNIFDGADNFFENTFKMDNDEYGRVSYKFILGKIYLHYNKLPEAKEAFEYVIKNGNSLYIVTEAKEILTDNNLYTMGDKGLINKEEKTSADETKTKNKSHIRNE